MQAELGLKIHPDELQQIVKSVFGTMMNLEVSSGEPTWFPGAQSISAAVQLTGDWNGSVVVECNREPACRFAGRFLSMETPAAVDDVVRDVLGELANMIGGNLKCVMTRGIKLSIPTVVDGSDYGLRVYGTEVSTRLTFNSTAGEFWVTTLETPASLALPPSSRSDSREESSRP